MNEEAVIEICPFCGYNTDNDYQMLLHLETLHAEGESPFVVKDDVSDVAVLEYEDDGHGRYANCPVEGCGEDIMLTELESHIEMHEAEERGEGFDRAEPSAAFGSQISTSLRNPDENHTQLAAASTVDRQAVAKAAWKSILRIPIKPTKPPESITANRRRLGHKSELGPYANEKQMPSWLVKLLESDGALTSTNKIDSVGKLRLFTVCPNRASGIIPVLQQLLQQDRMTEYAYLCNPAVLHISKLRREGGFCGYRNIQMMTSYIIEIQDFIENAWDLGINSQGRIETGGIRGTRKYIGTPDAQAMFCSLGINCNAQGLKFKKGGDAAEQLLCQNVDRYFVDGCNDFDAKVRCTSLPPIYFQHPGHSLTIVGFEKKVDGSRNVLVFDPMFHDSSDVRNLVGREFTHKHPADLLKAYRRGSRYLQKYKEFEVLKLKPPKDDFTNLVGTNR